MLNLKTRIIIFRSNAFLSFIFLNHVILFKVYQFTALTTKNFRINEELRRLHSDNDNDLIDKLKSKSNQRTKMFIVFKRK